MRQREDSVKVITVQAPTDHLLAPSITALVAAGHAVTIVTVIQPHQSALATTAAIQVAAHATSAARREQIEHTGYVVPALAREGLANASVRAQPYGFEAVVSG